MAGHGKRALALIFAALLVVSPAFAQSISTQANSVFRDYNTPGNALSGVYNPPKADVRALFNTIGTRLADSLSITDYGAVSGQNANAALQAALTACGATGKPVHVPAGNYIITASSNWPTANNLCPGIYGDGELSLFIVNDFNGPVIQATVQSGVPLVNKFIRDLSVRGQWTPSAPTYNNARLLNVSGSSDGWSYSRFERLSGYAVHDIIRFATPTTSVGGGLLQSNSGWNYFEGFFGSAGGAQVIYPDSFIDYADSTSTGNVYANFIGAPATAWVYVGGGANMMVGDMVFNGGQLGKGRVLYVAGSTCPLYARTIQINSIQVDADSTEAVKAECGFINNIKLNGNMGGSAPWAGIDYFSLSDVHDLGEGHWGAGGPVYVGGTVGAHTAALWTITLGAPISRSAALTSYTMTRIEISLTGVVGGVGGGGVIAVYDCAGGSGLPSECYLNSSRQIAVGSSGAVPAGWPVINAPTISGNVVTFTSTWTDSGSTASTLVSNIKTDHGALKVQRGANVVY